MTKFTLLATFALYTSGQALAATNIVYGSDNRLEHFEAPSHVQKLGNSTAAMVPTDKLVPLLNYFMLPPTTLKEDMKLCAGEKFENQLSAGLCSGFLVGPDLLVTAGHCVTSQYDCDKNSWVFDYKVNEKTGRADVITNASNVFKCKRVIDARLESSATGMVDYALIQLERVAEGREPLKYRSEGKISDRSEVYVVGYPSGLPQKYAADAQLVDNSETHYFKANLDTFGGNSGSSVFNSVTNEVEGILVRGARDYLVDAVRNCRVVNTVAQEITELKIFGESVSRITDIPSLKYRESLMMAAKAGELEKVKELAKLKVDLEISDNDNNSAMDYATMGGHTEVLEFIKAVKENGVEKALNAGEVSAETSETEQDTQNSETTELDETTATNEA